VWVTTPKLATQHGPRLLLITTSSITASSAVSKLRTEERDEPGAELLLTEAASRSTSKATKAGRDAWIRMSVPDRLEMLSRVYVIGNSPRIHEVDNEIRKEIVSTTWPKHRDAFLERLYGWWDDICIRLLVSNQTAAGATVSGDQLHERLRRLRDSHSTQP
jgi:hypothetical protein